MLPVSGLHFLVTVAYVILALGGAKIYAINHADRPLGKAVGVLTF